MSNFHDLDDVFDALRGPATPAELADETNSVDLMANAHLATKGKPMHSVSRRTRVATLIAAGVLGFGGVAAAGSPGLQISELEGIDDVIAAVQAPPDGVPPVVVPPAETPPVETPPEPEEEPVDEDVVDEDVVEEEPAEEQVEVEPAGALDEPTAEEEPVVTEPEDPNPDTDFNEVYCLDGNHGKTVSAVARGIEDEDDPLSQYSVVDAAKSDCGKDLADDDEVDGDEEAEKDEEADEDEKDEDEKDEAEKDEEEKDEDDKDVSGSSVEEERQGPPAHAGPKKASDAGDDGPGKGNGGSNGNGRGGR